MEASAIVYDVLPALTLDFAGGDGIAVARDAEAPYAVFRNEITEAADPLTDVPASDFFSLDVLAVESVARESSPPFLPPIRSAAAASAPPRGSERAWFRPGHRFQSPMLQLHKEILDFCEFISPSREEEASRQAALQSVSEVVKYIWPHCKVEVFGSFRTGLYLPTSDIDVVILNSNVKTPQMGLYALSKALSQRNVAKKIQVIAKARVPIIKFVEKCSGIAFDISFDLEGGPIAAEYIKDAVKKMPALRPLCLILKIFLHQRELNEVYSGGIGSYALLAMLITHLRISWSHHESSGYRLPKDKEHNLGVLLVKFFEFYGVKFNNWDIGISCSSSKPFFLKRDKGFVNFDRPNLIAIQDPQAPDNDIGKNSYNYFKVRSAFAMAFSALTDANAIAKMGPNRSILGTIIRPDAVLLLRKGGENVDEDVTVEKLFMGTVDLFPNGHDVVSNWLLNDEDPLPRTKPTPGEDATPSPYGKRSRSKSKHESRKDSHEGKRHRRAQGKQESGARRWY